MRGSGATRHNKETAPGCTAFTAITSMQHNSACASIRHSPVLHYVIGICTGYEGQYSLKTASSRRGAGGWGHWFLLATINRLYNMWDSVVNAYLLAPLANTRLEIGRLFVCLLQHGPLYEPVVLDSKGEFLDSAHVPKHPTS